MSMTRQEIKDLPADAAQLKAVITKQADIIASYETAKAQRIAAEKITAESPAGQFEIEVFQAKSALEGLVDGSEDYSDPRVRRTICGDAISLLGRMFDALPKS